MTESRWKFFICRLEQSLSRMIKARERLPDPADLGVTLSRKNTTLYVEVQTKLGVDVGLMRLLLAQVKADRDRGDADYEG